MALGGTSRTGAFVLFVAGLGACGTSGGEERSETGGTGLTGGTTAGTSTGGAGGSVTSGGASGSSGAGAGASGTSGSAGAVSCTTLTPGEITEVYPIPEGGSGWWHFAGTDGNAALIAITFDRLIRIVRVEPDGTSEVLLAETEFSPNWSFEPDRVLALRRADGIDVLLDDESGVSLVRKRGTMVSVLELTYTNYLDLHVLALAEGPTGLLAAYSRGEDPERLVVLDVDAVIGSSSTGVTDRVRAIEQTAPAYPGPAGFMAASANGVLWLGVERLDLSTDCTDTGEVTPCSGMDIPLLTCTWHLDLHRASSATLLGTPLVTIDNQAKVSRCDSAGTTLSSGLATLGRAVRFGRAEAHHTLAVDPETQRLALAVMANDRRDGTGTIDIALDTFDPQGTPLVEGAPTANRRPDYTGFLASKSGLAVYCADSACTLTSATGSTSLSLPALDDFEVLGTLPLPNGIALIGDETFAPTTAISILPLTCGN